MSPVSPACYLAKAFDGSEAYIPASQVFGEDLEVSKFEAWWISAWILERKSIQYSTKKEAWFDSENGNRLPSFTVKKHVPTSIKTTKSNIEKSLKR
jgi:hypothetical protein